MHQLSDWETLQWGTQPPGQVRVQQTTPIKNFFLNAETPIMLMSREVLVLSDNENYTHTLTILHAVSQVRPAHPLPKDIHAGPVCCHHSPAAASYGDTNTRVFFKDSSTGTGKHTWLPLRSGPHAN